MEFFQFIFAIVAISIGGDVLSKWIKHRTELAKLRMQAPAQADSHLRAEVESLRQELRQLRDTTLQYDMSFDSALERMETRVAGVERRVSEGEANRAAEARSIR